MSSGLLLSESESDTSETSGRQSDVLYESGSIKGKLEEFSAQLNQLQLENQDGEESEEEGMEDDSNGNTKSYISQESDDSGSNLRSSEVSIKDISTPADARVLLPEKVTIRLQPIGSVPEISPRVFQIASDQKFGALTKFLCKKLKLTHVYCYVNNAFAPSLDQKLVDLWAQFKVSEELIISYCETVAFG